MVLSKLPLAALSPFAMLATSAFANDADFKVVNKTGYKIDSVFVSWASNDSWGKDIMGKDALDDGTP